MRQPRTSTPPWERRMPHPRHPVGYARRRWPRAYDGAESGAGGVNRRYRRAYEAERRRGGRRPASPMLEQLRRSPVRNGLIGLAVAGAATPLALNRYQQQLRTDPSHERVSTRTASGQPVDEGAIASAAERMAAERAAEQSERQRVISESLQRYADFNLSEDLANDIFDLALEAGVEPEIAYGLIAAESSFKNTSTSYVGAIGLTQLMPRTAAWLVPGTTAQDLRDPETNVRIGLKYLRQLTDKYDGNVDLALTAYNRGPGTVDRILRRGGNPDNGYASFVKTGDVGSHQL